jgi:hypothetical protein
MSIARRLQKGDSGVDVDQLAALLSGLGYDTGQPNGKFDEQLERAVKEFQKDYGVNSDGKAGPTTLSALQKAVDRFTPGSIKVDQDTRRQIEKVQEDLVKNIERLDALCAPNFGGHTGRKFSRFTLTRTQDGKKFHMKFDPGVEIRESSLPNIPVVEGVDYIDMRQARGGPAGDAIAAISKAVNTNFKAMCYIDPPGICEPCSVVIIIVVRAMSM